MRTHTNEFKNEIKLFGREIDSQLTYNNTVIDNENLYNVTPILHTELLKSVMKGLNIETKVDIPIGSEINYQFGVKTRSGKNLLKYPYYATLPTTQADVTWNNNNGKITANGTATGYSGFALESNLPVQANTNYRFYIVGTQTNVTVDITGTGLGINIPTASLNNNGYVFNTANATTITINVKRQSNSLVEANFYPMLVIGTDTSTDYEPFGTYDYVDYGNYIVKESEYNEANENYTLKCYDKMLYSMKEYTTLQSAEFPLTVREYIGALCSDLDLDFANASDTFVNYDKVLQTDPYANINYTYRDIFDDLSEVTASNICINNDDELEVRYITDAPSKNLLKLYISGSGSSNGINYTINNDGSITLNGTATNIFYLNLNKNQGYFGHFTNGEIYTSYLKNAGNNIRMVTRYDATPTGTYLYTSYGDEYGIHTYNGVTNEDSFTYLTINAGQQVNNVTVYPMIVKGSYNMETIGMYEPYTDTVDEEYLKDINVKFGEKFGPVNTIVLSRSADSDKIARSIPADLADEDKVAITIRDNQIMNDDNREEYIDGILNQLNGLEFYLNDYTSTGITYLEVCDKYNVSANGSFYPCIMFNDEVNITQGLVEQIDTPMPETSEPDYKYVTPTDKIERTTSLIVDKVNSRITAQAETIEIIATNIDKETGDVNAVTTKQKKFTFNDEGLRISAGENGYNSLSDETGTYYYDGTTKVGEYTKDGSKQKDLSLFGAYKYGMDDIDDTPMFVAQMYTNNGEEAFGHFYNKNV